MGIPEDKKIIINLRKNLTNVETEYDKKLNESNMKHEQRNKTITDELEALKEKTKKDEEEHKKKSEEAEKKLEKEKKLIEEMKEKAEKEATTLKSDYILKKDCDSSIADVTKLKTSLEEQLNKKNSDAEKE